MAAAAVAIRPPAASPTTPAAPATRMRAVDGLRGLAVLGMILVNVMGTRERYGRRRDLNW